MDLVGAGGKMKICDFLSEERIMTALGSCDKQEAIALLAALVSESHQEIDRATLYQALCERERQASTAVGEGVAVPHARCSGLTQPIAAFARCAQGLEFDSLDGKPTHLFFLIVSPPDPPGRHLQVLARVSRLLADPSFRARSMRAASQTELLSLFREEDERFEQRLSAA
jgi:mannitol/fructose-specific phosphotransferase system IIA component (Ntr-type)